MVFGWISRFSLRTSDIHRPYSGLSTILVPNHFPSYPFPLRKGIFTKLLYPIGYSRSPTLRLYFVNRSKTIHYLIYEAGNWNCDLRQSVQIPSSCLFTLTTPCTPHFPPYTSNRFSDRTYYLVITLTFYFKSIRVCLNKVRVFGVDLSVQSQDQ